MRDENLAAVRIAEARTVLVSAGRDDASILIVLTARHLAPEVPISVVIAGGGQRDCSRIRPGRINVINPVRFTGLLLAGAAQGCAYRRLSDRPRLGRRAGCSWSSARCWRRKIGKSLTELATGGLGLRVYRAARM